jgi:GNAT superfamily N-acetyltransferase
VIHEPSHLRLQDLREAYDARLLEAMYEHVLEPSFAADELDPLDSIAAGLCAAGDPLTLAAVAVEGDAALGGLIGELYRRSGVLLIAYLAVSPDHRGRGIGSRLLAEAAAGWYHELDVALALGEVHDPRHYAAIEGPGALARLRLYGRLGARLLDMPFVQPALSPERRRVPQMLLLAFHVAPSSLAAGVEPPSLEPTRVRTFIRDYYTAAEGGVPAAEDVEYARLESCLTRPIRLLSVAELEAVSTSLHPTIAGLGQRSIQRRPE